MNPLTTKTIPKEKLASDLEFLEMLIKKMTQKLQNHSYEPKMQDALKAIQLKQKLAPASEAEKTFWELIDDLRKEVLYPEPSTKENLKAQILEIVIGLKGEVKKGALPVKTITDTFNQGRSKESQLTYKRIGRVLSELGFTKVRTGSGAFAIVWDEEVIHRLSKCLLGAEKYPSEKVGTSP
jgi:adenylosuccinate synthase